MLVNVFGLFIELCAHHCNQFQFISITLQRNITPMPPIPHLLSILSALALLLSSVVSLLNIPYKWNNRLKSLAVCFCIACSF